MLDERVRELVERVETAVNDFREVIVMHDRKVDQQLDRLEKILEQDRAYRRDQR